MFYHVYIRRNICCYFLLSRLLSAVQQFSKKCQNNAINFARISVGIDVFLERCFLLCVTSFTSRVIRSDRTMFLITEGTVHCKPFTYRKTCRFVTHGAKYMWDVVLPVSFEKKRIQWSSVTVNRFLDF